MINQNYVTPATKSGIIANIGNIGNLLSGDNKFKIYLYVLSTSPTAAIPLKFYGCTPLSGACASDTDFNKNIPGGKTYNAKDLLVEEIVIQKSTNGANITINGGTVYTF
jgi:hypothetical protein